MPLRLRKSMLRRKRHHRETTPMGSVMKATGPLLAALLLSLCLVRDADAQIWRWFGPKAPDKNPPAKSTQSDPSRVAEINVEVAWLADPVTFPYYLEAHATGSQMEVRGYVPNREVREQAVRIAQVYSSLPVVDAMKEHPSLLVKPGLLTAQQLQSSAQSSLRVALPKQSQQLKIECGSDGKVFVIGPVSSIEEKVIVSHSLRRLHGCTSVQNLTTLPSDVAQTPEPRERTPIVKTSNPTEPRDQPAPEGKPSAGPEVKSKSWFTWPFGRSAPPTKDEPPLAEPRKSEPPPIIDVKKPDDPIVLPKVPEPRNLPEEVKGSAPSVPAKTPALSRAELQKRIQAACPNAKNIEVQFTSATEVRISLEIRAEKDLEPTAERLFAMPELQNYRPDLQFKISSP
jgi:hypothetical protein